jgi:hypothetical protein
MKCKDCKHWTRSKESDRYLPEDELGTCGASFGEKVAIEVEAGWNGGYVSKIETDHDFFCANHELIKQLESEE